MMIHFQVLIPRGQHSGPDFSIFKKKIHLLAPSFGCTININKVNTKHYENFY